MDPPPIPNPAITTDPDVDPIQVSLLVVNNVVPMAGTFLIVVLPLRVVVESAGLVKVIFCALPALVELDLDEAVEPEFAAV